MIASGPTLAESATKTLLLPNTRQLLRSLTRGKSDLPELPKIAHLCYHLSGLATIRRLDWHLNSIQFG